MLRHLACLLPSIGCLVLWTGCREQTSSEAPLKHEVYLWQRLWDASVNQALKSHGASFERILFLAAEIDWRLKTDSVTLIQPDDQALRSSETPVGLVIRVQHFPQPEVGQTLHKEQLISLASTLMSRFSEQGLEISECQLDLDCPDARLEEYIGWLKDLREAIKPMPLSITALPSWLNEPSFSDLIACVDHYILQVHSIKPPTHREEALVLCDPQQAKLAVERAGQWQTPFRVALPTYGYWMQFDADGGYRRLSGETTPSLLHPDGSMEPLMADPHAMADLVHHWQQSHPRSMTGLIWFRLPVASDRMNWRWETLASVMQGRPPKRELTYTLKNPEPGYWEIWARNTGEIVSLPRDRIALHWTEGVYLAADGLLGYQWQKEALQNGSLHPPAHEHMHPVDPGKKHLIGWIRFQGTNRLVLESSSP
ncbi:MAG: DUF3142 domain-containing protein [Limisphaerales bacterium]